MKILISEKLSPHRFKTPEGYLICTDSILARTGKQTYKRGEVFGLDCNDSDADVEVDRRPEEVFSEKTMASFENKPLCVEHPDCDVNAHNHNEYAVGFVRDVHKGTVDGQDVVLGTLVVTDAKTIEEIENGEHTDLSCGYDCDIEDDGHPQQRNIRGNHVALCQQGRAGIARIVDSMDDAQNNIYEVGFVDKYADSSQYVEVQASSVEDAKAKVKKQYDVYRIFEVRKVATRDSMEKKLYKVYLTGCEDCNNVMYVKAMSENDARRIADRHTDESIIKVVEYGTTPLSKIDAEKILKDPNRYFEDEKTKDADYSKESEQGYKVIDMYRDGQRLHAILKRPNDYVVALGYDLTDGTWGQGRYVDEYEDALATLKREKPNARKTQEFNDAKTPYDEASDDLSKNVKKFRSLDSALRFIRCLRDDRLSPMTYRKLKELGVKPEQWKKWTQEQANQFIASKRQGIAKQTTQKSTSSSSTKKSTRTKAPTEFKTEEELLDFADSIGVHFDENIDDEGDHFVAMLSEEFGDLPRDRYLKAVDKFEAKMRKAGMDVTTDDDGTFYISKKSGNDATQKSTRTKAPTEFKTEEELLDFADSIGVHFDENIDDEGDHFVAMLSEEFGDLPRDRYLKAVDKFEAKMRKAGMDVTTDDDGTFYISKKSGNDATQKSTSSSPYEEQDREFNKLVDMGLEESINDVERYGRDGYDWSIDTTSPEDAERVARVLRRQGAEVDDIEEDRYVHYSW